MSDLKVIQFPDLGTASIAAGLDNLKEIVEVGIDGDPEIESLVWVTRNKAGDYMVGALGRCPGGLDEAAGIMTRAICRLTR